MSVSNSPNSRGRLKQVRRSEVPYLGLLTLCFTLLICTTSPISVSAASNATPEGAMTQAERSYLMTELKSSQAALLSSIKGLTPAQWKYKPAPEAWSIEECAEHVILADELLFTESQKMLQNAATDRLPTATADGDRQVVAQLTDRSTKAKAPKPIQPQGKFDTPDSAIRQFNIERSKTIEYVKHTNDPLRAHSGEGPAGNTVDVYQFILSIAAHSARHTEQVREVKTSPGYPHS
jgi:DinB superfamily